MKTIIGKFKPDEISNAFKGKRVKTISRDGSKVVRYDDLPKSFLFEPHELDEKVCKYLEDYIDYIRKIIGKAREYSNDFSTSIDVDDIKLIDLYNSIENVQDKEETLKLLKNEIF